MSRSSEVQAERRIQPIRLLFVCMGNICRSPAAAAVMRKLIEQRGLAEKIIVDSAGTTSYHQGGRADHRMSEAAARRGYATDWHRARQIRAEDFCAFDFILAMDEDNMLDLREQRRFSECPNVKLLLEYCTHSKKRHVPDPYYGGPEGFEQALDLLECACADLLEHLVVEHKLS